MVKYAQTVSSSVWSFRCMQKVWLVHCNNVDKTVQSFCLQ